MKFPSTKSSEASANSGNQEISEFSAYFYMIMSSIQIIFLLFATILYCLVFSWWFSPIFILIGIGTYFVITFFRFRKTFLRYTSLGLATSSIIILVLPTFSILPPWTSYTAIIVGIVIFIQNYRETRFIHMRSSR